MRIVLVSNSQGTTQGVRPGRHYPALVRQELAPEDDVHLLVISGWSIGDVVVNVANIVDVEPDLVIVQLGIVEAARRILSTTEKRLLAQLGRRGRKVSGMLHRQRAAVIRARGRLRIDTRLYSPQRFERELVALLEALRETEVLLFEIPPFGREYERVHYPLIGDDVETFNAILRRHGAVPLLPPGADTETLWQPGTVHFTEDAHRVVAEHVVALARERSARRAAGAGH